MKQVMKALLLATLLSAFAAQSAILVDFGASTNRVTGNATAQGLTTNAWKHVPFSMVSPRSPTNGAAGYAGPVYYGGATGTVSMTSWNIANSTPDYINADGTSTGIGSKVTALIMFTNQSATITQVVYGVRVGGTSTAQTNSARIVVRKTDGSFYISEPKSSQDTACFTNSNPGALTWYNYNPSAAFLTIGSQAAGLTLNNVDAIGEFIENRITATKQTTTDSGLQVFQARGDTVQNQTITTDGNTDPVSGFGNTVSARIGANQFSWTFDQNVNWGHFIDGMPWVVLPNSGYLSLVSATPARVNNTNAPYFISASVSGWTNADINITVRNPPFDHTFNTNTLSYLDGTNGVFGWDSRRGTRTATRPYNPALGWSGTTGLSLSAGDSIATAKSTIQNPMPSRSSPLDAVAVLTVLTNIPPTDAFRPAVIRGGTDRTSPEILKYSDLIDLSPYLISNPVGVTTDLRGTNVTSIGSEYTYNSLKACLPGPWFINGGYSTTEGAAAHYNNYAYPAKSTSDNYGSTLGMYMGRLAIGSMGSWLTEDERKLCRIRYIQRAIDAYGAVKAGVCLEEGAGILPGYSTLITVAGVMMNHSGMKAANQGINGVKPWWIFADYATTWHTDGISTNDLAIGETMNDRLVALYNTSTSRSNLNKTNVQIAAASSNTMTMKTNFWWDLSRPMINIINLKVKIVSGTGAGPTIYVITDTITATNLLTNDEKFRTKGTGSAVLYNPAKASFGYLYGGKVVVKPAWQNGIPTTDSILAFSTTTSDTDDPASDHAEWYWAVDGVVPNRTKASFLERKQSLCTSPMAEYSSIQAGGTIGNLIALYALGQQNLYKGGLDKYMINVGERAGYGEKVFSGPHFDAVGSGETGNFLGALWKQEVLNVVGVSFRYTDGTTGALAVPHTHAKMFYEP